MCAAASSGSKPSQCPGAPIRGLTLSTDLLPMGRTTWRLQRRFDCLPSDRFRAPNPKRRMSQMGRLRPTASGGSRPHKRSVDVHVQIVDNQVPPSDTTRHTTYGFHLPAAMERRACLLVFTWRIDSRNADGSSLHLSANRSGVASLRTRLGATVLELDSHTTESVVRTPWLSPLFGRYGKRIHPVASYSEPATQSGPCASGVEMVDAICAAVQLIFVAALPHAFCSRIFATRLSKIFFVLGLI